MGKKRKKEKKKELGQLLEEILDYVPTDIKYSAEVEKLLIELTGHSFITKKEQKQYKDSESRHFFEGRQFDRIPGYIHAEDLTIWEAEKIMYDAEIPANYQTIYPEAFNEEISRQYTLTKKSE